MFEFNTVSQDISMDIQLAVEQYVNFIIEKAEKIVRSGERKWKGDHPGMNNQFSKMPYDEYELKRRKKRKSDLNKEHRIEKFLYFDRGLPVYLDNKGKKVDRHLKPFKPNVSVPGSAYEMDKLRFFTFRWSAGEQEHFIPKCVPPETRKRLLSVVQKPGFHPYDAYYTHKNSFGAYGYESFIKKIPNGKNIPFVKKKNHQVQFQHQPNYIKDRRSTESEDSVTSAEFRRTSEFFQPVALKPANTFIPAGCITVEVGGERKLSCYCPPVKMVRPDPYPPNLLEEKGKIKTSKQDPYPPNLQEKIGKNKRSPSIMAKIAADCLFNPGTISHRPVRGFRTLDLVLPSKRKSLPKSNRESDFSNPEQLRNSKRFSFAAGHAGPAGNNDKKRQMTFHEPLQLLRADSEVYTSSEMKKSQSGKGDRKLANLKTVSLPKKGRIKLTALPYELHNPQYFDERIQAAEKRAQIAEHSKSLMGPPLPSPNSDPLQRTLIRNKSILKQVKSDLKHLESSKGDNMREINQHIEKDGVTSFVEELLNFKMTGVPNINTNMLSFVSSHKNNSVCANNATAVTLASGGVSSKYPIRDHNNNSNDYNKINRSKKNSSNHHLDNRSKNSSSKSPYNNLGDGGIQHKPTITAENRFNKNDTYYTNGNCQLEEQMPSSGVYCDGNKTGINTIEQTHGNSYLTNNNDTCPEQHTTSIKALKLEEHVNTQTHDLINSHPKTKHKNSDNATKNSPPLQHQIHVPTPSSYSTVAGRKNSSLHYKKPSPRPPFLMSDLLNNLPEINTNKRSPASTFDDSPSIPGKIHSCSNASITTPRKTFEAAIRNVEISHKPSLNSANSPRANDINDNTKSHVNASYSPTSLLQDGATTIPSPADTDSSTPRSLTSPMFSTQILQQNQKLQFSTSDDLQAMILGNNSIGKFNKNRAESRNLNQILTNQIQSTLGVADYQGLSLHRIITNAQQIALKNVPSSYNNDNNKINDRSSGQNDSSLDYKQSHLPAIDLGKENNIVL